MRWHDFLTSACDRTSIIVQSALPIYVICVCDGVAMVINLVAKEKSLLGSSFIAMPTTGKMKLL